MIPKLIHYCWFGGKKLPAAAEKCLASWQTLLPGWELKRWDESNVDFSSHPYMKFCCEHHLWAYLSDFVRLKVLEEHGGVYFDTDVELVRYDASLFENSEVSAFFGFETKEFVNTGLGFACEPHHIVVKRMLELYNSGEVALACNAVKNGANPGSTMLGCPQLNTRALVEMGMKQDGNKQYVSGALILPIDWMCPYDDATGVLNKTVNTISIHWFMKSPHGKWARWKAVLLRPIRRILHGK